MEIIVFIVFVEFFQNCFVHQIKLTTAIAISLLICLHVQDLLHDASGHQDPIIFFRDIRYTDLENLVTFIYTGAVQVHTTDLFPANIFRSIKIFSNNYFSVVLHFDIIR